MSDKCTCKEGHHHGGIYLSAGCHVHGKPAETRSTTSDFKIGDTWHRAGCDGNCDVAFGCAAQWHPEEIAAIKAAAAKSALRDKTSSERKAEPIYAGAVMYFPDALAAMARLSVSGNNKHNPGEPLHWARGKSMDQLDAAQRHLINPDAIDPETGETELTAAFWRIGAQLQLQQERLNKEKGVKSYSGVVAP